MSYRLVMQCPTTQAEVGLSILVESMNTFETMKFEDSYLDPCPACGGQHLIVKEELTLDREG